MDDLNLSDTLQRYFSDVFLCCDEEKSGKSPLNKTLELIKSGNVPEDVVSQISEICWTPGTNYLNKKQFFSVLKLVAAYQANIPVTTEIVSKKIDLLPPRFAWNAQDTESPVPDLIELRNDADYNTDPSTDSEPDSETVRCSPEVSSPASDSPTPTNSVQDRNWVISGAWRGLVSEEQRQLLGTEEESSDRHSSDDETDYSSEVWTITPEQREYYTNQFKKLQDNPNALLAGPVARTFFERSQLPVQELRKIWQLSDVTRDGALSLQEFNTAMHLVVLRKHKIPIPDVLPSTLVPRSEYRRSASPETEPMLSPQAKDGAKEWTKFVDSPTSSVSSPGPKPVNFDFQIDQNDPDLRHPVARRLTPEIAAALQNDDVLDTIDLHSPKKNLDCSNLQVIHNLAPNNPHNSAIQRPQPKKVNVPGPGAIPPPPNSQQNAAEDGGPVSLPSFPPPKKEKPPPPPPRPFKTHGRSSSLDLNKLSKLGAPPTVPPRVSPSGQSKRLTNQKSEGDYIAPTETAPSFGDFDQFGEKYENVHDEVVFPGDVYEAERKKLFAQLFAQESPEEVPRKHGAFEVYRKPLKPASESPLDVLEEERWEEFERLQVENTALLRTCQELSQMLADVKEEKFRLKVRLEQLETQENGG
ncbi:ralBP1-associated Eps domain-containing protein 2 [Cylas formicarius]|uniref:ralBP1-associated Eps domain-containing protein 2 n=1 Tax=Cylas formicarius TaxID=197179 RepID=UPI002958A7F5|nr:ralBP1-associated Eps domain-containing protein 2 [Cylas formicarius]